LTYAQSSDTIRRVRAYFAIFGLSIVAAVACGARTGLDVPVPPHHDAGPDVVDAPPDAPPDVFDAPPDAPPDVTVVPECADAGTQYIYLITEENNLYHFYPPDIPNGTAYSPIGQINCPAAMGDTPFSMGVDRKGIAYCVFQSGNLFRFAAGDPANTCKATPYVPTKIGNGVTFGMGFASDLNDPGETLYIASDDPAAGPTTPELLGSIDVKSFTLNTVGQFPKVIGSAELTGTGSGRLFGFGVSDVPGNTTYRFLEFDTTNAGLITDIPLQMPTDTQSIVAWAFAFWGGDFYFFTSTQTGSSNISRYTPQPGDATATAKLVLQVQDTIVGAGVSTCAPLQQ
jgi:hypothetical protein